jgi:DNA-binding HxlR family transcriptional regulator
MYDPNGKYCGFVPIFGIFHRMLKDHENSTTQCPTEAALAVIGGRWKVPILWNLFKGTLRFGELSRSLPMATQKMLTQQLRELERDGLVLRKVYAEIPPKVEYSLTPMGRTLEPVLAALNAWGTAFIAQGTKLPKSPKTALAVKAKAKAA